MPCVKKSIDFGCISRQKNQVKLNKQQKNKPFSYKNKPSNQTRLQISFYDLFFKKLVGGGGG
ncbi:hypothetical protein ACVGV7_14475, partial [Enterobacter intestinihominis]